MIYERSKVIPDLIVIYPESFEDNRGFFTETYQSDKYKEIIGEQEFLQDNLSYSKKDVIRGLHYQLNNPQGKLVRCVKGIVYDVAVDIRPDSTTFGKWDGVLLTSDTHTQFWIPPGFAHGFSVISDEAYFEYKCTTLRDAKSEGALSYNDRDLNIDWKVKNGIISDKDKSGISFEELKCQLLKPH